MKVSVITLGCKVNQYESQAMLDQLVRAGFSACESAAESDIVLINSCTVTSTSDHKVRQTLHRARRGNPSAVIVLTGCMPQAFPELAEQLTDADIVLGNSNRHSLVPDILQYLSSRQRIVDIVPHEKAAEFESMQVERFFERTRAFIKIEDGCNRFCSYCIIPYARGRVRSKPLEELREEVEHLAANGYREIVLTGINLSAYGQELGLHLCDAVEAACMPEGIARVRLGSLEPEQLSVDVIAPALYRRRIPHDCPKLARLFCKLRHHHGYYGWFSRGNRGRVCRVPRIRQGNQVCKGACICLFAPPGDQGKRRARSDHTAGQRGTQPPDDRRHPADQSCLFPGTIGACRDGSL